MASGSSRSCGHVATPHGPRDAASESGRDSARDSVDSAPEAIVTLVRATDFKSGGGCGDTASAGSIPVRFRQLGCALGPARPDCESRGADVPGSNAPFRALDFPTACAGSSSADDDPENREPSAGFARELPQRKVGRDLAKLLPQALERAEKSFRTLCYNHGEGRSRVLGSGSEATPKPTGDHPIYDEKPFCGHPLQRS